MGFEEFKLDEKILNAIKKTGYTEPTQIQKEAIPKALQGDDIRASAQTGTGKTAAFLIPAIQKIIDSPRQGGKGAKILVLTPTRELAQQITVQAEKYSNGIRNISSVCVVGGVPYQKQQAKLSRPYDILIATPGRLIDYMNRGKINFSNLEMIVLDEADRMLDMGFSEPVEEIISKTPGDRQTLLFSATLKGEVLKLSQKFMKNPTEIVIHSDGEKHENIEQKLLYVDNIGHKNDLLDHILNAEDLKAAIIFTATKRHCDELVDQLEDKGFYAGALHGDMNQRQRSRTIKMLKDGKINILVATDVAARGIDIPSISHVINFDLPRDTEDYVHRIGRTGRAGRNGVAISLAGSKDIHMVPRIEKYTGQKISVIEIQGLEAKTKPRAQSDGPKSRNSKSRSPRGRGGDRRSSGRGGDSRGSGERRGSNSRGDSRGYGDKRSSDSRGDSRGYGDKRSSDSRGDSRGYGDKRSSDSRGDSRGYGDRRSSGSRGDSRRSNDRREGGGSFGDRKTSKNRSPSEKSFSFKDKNSSGGRPQSRTKNRSSEGSFRGARSGGPSRNSDGRKPRTSRPR